jgi:nucleoside-diphosphate-sugar epimerase
VTTYFLTGGEGFIGYHISRVLADDPDAEIVTYDAQKHYVPLDRSYWPTFVQHRVNSLDDKNVTRIRGDTTDRGLLKESLKTHEPDVIIHLAALPIANVSNKYPEEARTNILDGTITLLDVLREVEFEFDRVVYTSSSMVYGDFATDDDGNVVPPSETADCKPKGLYGSMKLSGEHVTRAYTERFDIPHTIIRPSAVYGPTDANRRVSEIFITNAMKGERLRLDNGGYHKLDFTYVKDVARGFIRAATHENAINETYNMTRGDGRSIRELAAVISDIVPGTETYVKEMDVTRPNRGTLNISKAREDIGYDPDYSLEEGMREYHDFLTQMDVID